MITSAILKPKSSRARYIRYNCHLRIKQRLYQQGRCRCYRLHHDDFSPSPLNVALKSIQEKHAINLPCELALIVEDIDGALNEILATLGLKGYNVLIPNGSVRAKVPCSFHTLFSWSMHWSCFWAFWLHLFLLVVDGCFECGWRIGRWNETWNPSRVERRSASRFSCIRICRRQYQRND